jgi:hypothetical protein
VSAGSRGPEATEGGDVIRVRDHSRTCEHGSQWSHWMGARPKWWQPPDCLGGRELILRRVDPGTWVEVEPPAAATEPAAG